MHRKTTFTKRLLLSLLSIIFTLSVILIVAEIYLRINSPYILDASSDILETNMDYVVMHTSKGKRMRPNADVLIKNHFLSHLDVRIKTDKYGFRSPELSDLKIADVPRILVLGDSITQAGYIDEQYTYVAQLRHYLQEMTGNEYIEVINAGVGDIGLEEEIDILEDLGLQVNPDIVIVGFYLNDSRPPWGFVEELGHPNWLRRHSLLVETVYKYLKYKQFIKEKGLNRMQWTAYMDSDWETNKDNFRNKTELASLDWGAAWQESSWNIIDSQLQRLKNLSQNHNFEVMLAVFPVSYQLNTSFEEKYPQDKMKTLTDKYGFFYLDLYPILKENKDWGLYFDHCHPNILGNELVGKEIATFMINSDLIQ